MLGRGAKDKEHAMSQKLESAIAVIGIDIGKNSFHVVGHDERGAIVLRHKWSRGQVEARFANMPPCLIGMEACVGAHHLSRKLKALGHDARLMPAKYVRPYSKGQKNDFRDAEARRRPAAGSDGVRRQALMAMITAPAAIRPMPIHPVAEGRSPRNANAKSATSTTLNLSIGATIEAGPSLSARK
jgi:hypothetical protein